MLPAHGEIAFPRSETFAERPFDVPSEMQTMYGAIRCIAKMFPDRSGYSQRKMNTDGTPAGYESFTYRQTLHRIKRLAYGLANIGCKNGTHIAVLAPSCFAWILSDFAISAIGGVLIPLYDSWSVESMVHVIEHSQTEVLIIHPSVSRKMNMALKGKIKDVIVMDIDDRSRCWCTNNAHLFLDEHELLNIDFDSLTKQNRYIPCMVNSKTECNGEENENSNEGSSEVSDNSSNLDGLDIRNIALYTDSISLTDVLRLALELKQNGIRIHRMSSLLECTCPKKGIEMPRKSKPDDIHSIVYTSGTSGVPKGAVLTELSFMNNGFAMVKHTQHVFKPRFLKFSDPNAPHFIPEGDSTAVIETYFGESSLPDIEGKKEIVKQIERECTTKTPPSYICMLPLAHVFERTTVISALLYMMRIHFLSGYNYDYDTSKPDFVPRQNSVGSIMKDIPSVVPGVCILVTVPRLIERIKESVDKEIMVDPTEKLTRKEKIKKALLRYVINSQVNEYTKTGRIKPLWDKLVMSHIREKLSKNLKLLIVGGSACERSVINFAKCVFNCSLSYGYGMTETAGCVLATLPSSGPSGKMNSQGKTIGSNTLCLLDRPDLAYTKELNNSGEVVVAGPPVFQGYYKDEQATRNAFVELDVETFDKEGKKISKKQRFYRTGDIGTQCEDGTLLLIDRANNIFKLSQGEFIVADKLDALYTGGLISQVVVTGNSKNNEIIAILVINKHVLSKGLMVDAKEKVAMDASVLSTYKARSMVFGELLRKAKEAKCAGYEIPRTCVLTFDDFNINNGLLTASMKIRRNAVIKKYSDYIEALYEMKARPESGPKEEKHDETIVGLHGVSCQLLTHEHRVLCSCVAEDEEAVEEVFIKK